MSNNTTRVNNPMKVITGPDTRWSYANVWEPKSINGGTPKYSVSLIIPKSDTRTVAKIKAAIEAAYQRVSPSSRATARVCLRWLLSRPLCAMVMLRDPMTPHTPMPTSSTPIPQPLQASWMLTATLC